MDFLIMTSAAKNILLDLLSYWKPQTDKAHEVVDMETHFCQCDEKIGFR